MSRSVQQDNSKAQARERELSRVWAAQQLRLPVWWYESIANSGASFVVDGDSTALVEAAELWGVDPSSFFAQSRIAHGSRPLPLRA